MRKHDDFQLTQDMRLELVRNALWFSAVRYEREGQRLLASVDVEDAANSVLGMMDELGILLHLPSE